MRRTEVRQEKDDVGNEATSEQTEQSACRQEAGASRQPKLRKADNGPEANLSWNPAIGSNGLADELRRQLCAQEAELEDSVSEVVS